MTLSDDVKGWASSVTIWSAGLSGLASAAAAFFHWQFPTDFVPTVAASGVAIVTAIGAIIGRIKAVNKIG